MSKNVIRALWIKDSWCEYCSNSNCDIIYLPFTKNTLNPAHICKDCVKDYNIVDWYDDELQYYKDLEKLKKE